MMMMMIRSRRVHTTCPPRQGLRRTSALRRKGVLLLIGVLCAVFVFSFVFSLFQHTQQIATMKQQSVVSFPLLRRVPGIVLVTLSTLPCSVEIEADHVPSETSVHVDMLLDHDDEDAAAAPSAKINSAASAAKVSLLGKGSKAKKTGPKRSTAVGGAAAAAAKKSGRNLLTTAGCTVASLQRLDDGAGLDKGTCSEINSVGTECVMQCKPGYRPLLVDANKQYVKSVCTVVAGQFYEWQHHRADGTHSGDPQPKLRCVPVCHAPELNSQAACDAVHRGHDGTDGCAWSVSKSKCLPRKACSAHATDDLAKEGKTCTSRFPKTKYHAYPCVSDGSSCAAPANCLQDDESNYRVQSVCGKAENGRDTVCGTPAITLI